MFRFIMLRSTHNKAVEELKKSLKVCEGKLSNVRERLLEAHDEIDSITANKMPNK